MYKVISFYRYVEVKNPEALRDSVRKVCKETDILGRILIAKEGINGAVSGTVEAIDSFKLFTQSLFPGITFRSQHTERNAYHKLIVRVREEICAFGRNVNLADKGIYLKPKELQELYAAGEDFVVVDARNDYEVNVGHFKDAVKLPIQNFKEFADVAPKALQESKDKKVVLYCTGGIRCEKATAYLKQEGFENVFHLEGGIINYLNQVGDDKWEGGLFVFDDRLVSEQGSALTSCTHCKTETQKMTDCHELGCDRLFVICAKCQREWNNTCSVKCKNSPYQRPEKVKEKEIGVVENYYARNQVALVRLTSPLASQATISIRGKTTQFQQIVSELRDEQGNKISSGNKQLVTFPVKEKIRKNDKVLVPSC